MSVLRKDPITGSWVIIAEERASRPRESNGHEHKAEARTNCPFCEGHESETPPEIIAIRQQDTAPNGPGWSVRVVPNRYAALRIEGELDRTTNGIYDSMHGIGAHEVIIETPDHDGKIGQYSVEKLESILRIYRERTIDLHRDIRFRYIQIFRNYGQEAGASQEHPHSQLIALPIVPRWIREELLCAREHFEKTEKCLFCDMIANEVATQERVVDESPEFLAFTPFASKFPFETWILPKQHSHDFQLAGDQTLRGLAEIMRRTIWALEQALENPPYNYMLHGVPEHINGGSLPDSPASSLYYHWHLEIIPRVTNVAGFEWGTGFHINHTAPEKAAARMREALQTLQQPVAS